MQELQYSKQGIVLSNKKDELLQHTSMLSILASCWRVHDSFVYFYDCSKNCKRFKLNFGFFLEKVQSILRCFHFYQTPRRSVSFGIYIGLSSPHPTSHLFAKFDWFFSQPGRNLEFEFCLLSLMTSQVSHKSFISGKLSSSWVWVNLHTDSKCR